MQSSTGPTAFPSLVRKAAVDAGFDLEPEADGAWWHLRASGIHSKVWVHPLSGGQALLALSEHGQLDVSDSGVSEIAVAQAPPLPEGASGIVYCGTAISLFSTLQRLCTAREHSPEKLRARWESGVAKVFSSQGHIPATSSIPMPGLTEELAEVRRRVGQEVYREALLDYWEGACAVTGLVLTELLRASHAKPWAEATDAERLDVHNGLLLAVHLDALFDRGFLTFDETGAGVFSSALTAEDRERLGLPEAPPRLRRIHPDHLPYLAWHRAHVFRP